MSDPRGIETQLADLSGLTVDEVQGLCRDLLAPALEVAVRQVNRPRINLGGTNPPGRAD